MDPMRIVYLTGEHVYLRPLVAGDKECAVAWYPGPFFLDRTRAEKRLKEETGESSQRLAMVRSRDNETVGSVEVQGREHFRRCVLSFHMAPTAPDADTLCAQAARLLVPWLRDDVEVMVVVVETASDQVETIAALEGMGMGLAVRLREFEARPSGRADGLRFEALNPRWEVRDA
jgi:RimJ/RimL family protein N-acetyltransferase